VALGKKVGGSYQGGKKRKEIAEKKNHGKGGGEKLVIQAFWGNT